MKRKITTVYLALCFVLLSACVEPDRNENKSQDLSSEIPSQQDGAEKNNTSWIAGAFEKDHEIYFVSSLQDFIDCYNNYYYADHGKNYIQPYSEWYSDIQDFGRHQGDMFYEFTEDRKIWTLPTITVYTPKNKTLIKELTVNFDDHSYTDKMYRQYEEMCLYTLKVFFPDMSEKSLTKLYKKINRKAYDNIFQNEQGFHSDNPPSDLYYRNGTGVYPYFAYGESVRMCVIPVTKRVIKTYKKKGVKIHKFYCKSDCESARHGAIDFYRWWCR